MRHLCHPDSLIVRTDRSCGRGSDEAPRPGKEAPVEVDGARCRALRDERCARERPRVQRCEDRSAYTRVFGVVWATIVLLS